MFRYCETKNFRRKILILPPPPLIHKLFATGNFVKHSTEGFHQQSFSVLQDKKNSTESRDITLLNIKFFDTRNFVKHSTLPLRNFRHCETKNIRRKILILPPSPLSINFFFDTRSFLKHKRVPLRKFSAL